MKRLAAVVILLAFAAFLRGDEVRTGTGTTVGALPAGEVDPYPAPTQVPSLLCLTMGIPGGPFTTAYRLHIGNVVDVGPTYYHQTNMSAWVTKPVVPDPATWTRGDPETWLYECKSGGGTVDYTAPPGGATFGGSACRFTCADIGIIALELWATNSLGSDFCAPGTVSVEDPNGLCGGP